MIIAFHTPTITYRGTCVALFDYATYNESYLHNKSIVITDYNKRSEYDNIAFKWISDRFPIFLYETIDQMEEILAKHNVDMLYCIKYGINDGVYSRRVKTVVHCVFDMSQPHENVYAGVSISLARKFDSTVYVPHMINLDPTLGESLRERLHIPKDAIVFGRHGGFDTFNVDFCKETISKIVRERSDIYFIFMVAKVFDVHPQLLYLDETVNMEDKKRFIRTCDAMIVCEHLGHSFGIACGMFSVYNKPIIAYARDVWNTAHIDILQDKGLYFFTQDEFYELVVTFCPFYYKDKDLNAYREYTPKKVMKQFKDVFIQS